MEIFDKKKPRESNEIRNSVLRARLMDAAFNLLAIRDYMEIANTMCTFGYLFDIEGHGIEALFKLKTDRKTAYFAVQGDKLIRLNFNEELFKSTTEDFLELHK